MCTMNAMSSEQMKTTKITLYGNHVGPVGARFVADTMRETPTLRVVNLQTNDIGVEGAELLADALESDTCGLAKLCLGWQNIRDEGAAAIARALLTNRTLTTCNLPSCGLTDKAAVPFAEAL